MNFIIYLSSINLIGFLMIIIDKRKAIKNKWRIKETYLLTTALIGGCFGIYFGMHLIRHKTKKLKFKLIPLICIIWLMLIYVLFTKII